MRAEDEKIGKEVEEIGKEVERIGKEVERIGKEVERIGKEVERIGKEVEDEEIIQDLKIKKGILRLVAAVVMMIAAVPAIHAQEDYRFDIGAGLGMSGYLGDANPSNPWKYPGLDGELLFRYIANPRWGFKTNFYVAQLRGDTKDMENVMPEFQQYRFSTTVYELGEVAEFNFFNYGMGETYRKLKRFTPYIAAGLGFNLWQTDGKTCFAVNIPVGVGVKYKVSKRVNLGLEFLMKKVFTDRLDSQALKDPYQIQSSFLKNTDWYSTLTFTVSYEFSKRCEVCHYKE